MSTKLAITVIKSSASFEQGCWVQTRKSCHQDIVKDWPPFCSESKFRPRSPLNAGMSSRGGSQVGTEWADVHTATDRLKKIDQILKTELLYIFAPRTGNWQSRLNLTVFQWFYHDNPRLDFRRLPGPIFDPPRGMRAGSFSRTAAGNRAYDTGGRGGGEPGLR